MKAKTYKNYNSLVFWIIGIILILFLSLFLIRSFSERQVDDVSPNMNCEDTILKKADDDKKKTDLKVLPIIAKDTVTSILITKTGIIFKVQFASTDKEINLKTKFTNVEDIWFYKTGNVFKYTSGNFATMEEATKQQFKLKEKGYKDCFVAAFKNNVRIDINEARKLTE